PGAVVAVQRLGPDAIDVLVLRDHVLVEELEASLLPVPRLVLHLELAGEGELERGPLRVGPLDAEAPEVAHARATRVAGRTRPREANAVRRGGGVEVGRRLGAHQL